MKKIIAFISALTICTSAFSCSKKNDAKSPQQSFSVETLGNVAYKTERLDVPDDMTMIYCVEAFDKCSKYFVVGAGSHGVDFWIANSDFTSFTTVDVPDFDYGANYMLDAADDGTIVSFVNDVSYGDLPDPDPMSEDFNEEEYKAAAEYKFRIMAYSADGKLISNNEVKDYQVFPEEMTHITECASDGKIVIVTIDGSTEVFSVDGTYLGEFKADDGETIENFGKNTNGELIAAVRTSENNIQLRKVNEKGELSPSSVTYELSETVYGEIEPGYGDYTMFVRSMTTIYGIRSGDNSIVPLFSINRAGLNSSNFSDFAMCPDGNFVVPVTNYSNWSCKLKKFVPCDPSELENIQTLTVGVKGRDWRLEEYLDIFNDENQDYQVSLKIYGGNEMDYDLITEQIQQDALSGNLPDVIVCSGLDGMMAHFSTIQMDVLCDLYEFMDKDDTLTRDAFVPSLLNHIDYNFDGHAYLLPEAFSIRLPYTAKTEFVKDIKDWDFNAYMDLLESPPDGMADEYKNREETQWRRLDIRFDDYVDFKNISCHFDSPEFIRALKYAYEGKPDNQDDYVSDNEEYDHDAEQRSYSYALRENRELFTNGHISSYTSYIDFTKGTFGGEPITVLGNFGSGKDKAVIETDGTTYGITRTSENKELAWKFIKHMLSDEYINDYRINDGSYHWGINFAPTVSGMKLVADYEKKPVDHKYEPTLKDYDGCAFNTWTKDENGDYIYERLGRVDDNVIAEVDALIASAQPTDQSYIYGVFSDEQANTAYYIFMEEVDRFFHGETSAEECASLIQSRISIYLSEQFD